MRGQERRKFQTENSKGQSFLRECGYQRNKVKASLDINLLPEYQIIKMSFLGTLS